jgi:hypothetical protein
VLNYYYYRVSLRRNQIQWWYNLFFKENKSTKILHTAAAFISVIIRVANVAMAIYASGGAR